MKMIVWFVFVLGALSAAGDVFIVKIGQKVTLDCGASSYRRALVWNHGADLLFSVDQRGFSRRGTVELVKRSAVRHMNLEISGVRETDAGTFTCSADGTPQEHSLVLVSVSLSVSVSVAPSAVLQLGSEATLQCEVNGLDKDYEVEWRNSHAGSVKEKTIKLKPVSSLHNGTWQCVITYGGQQLTESLTIRVQEPPPRTIPLSTAKNITIFATVDPKTPCAICTAMDDPLGISCWMWLAMGVCCLFAILLMLCVMVCVKVFCTWSRRRPLERHSSNLYV